MSGTMILHVVKANTIADAMVVPSGTTMASDGKSAACGNTTFAAPDGAAFAIISGGVIGYGWDGKTVSAPATTPQPPLARTATVSLLLDALSTTQRGTIAADRMIRLVARGAMGHVIITDPKVGRAAADMGITPDAWFTLVGA